MLKKGRFQLSWDLNLNQDPLEKTFGDIHLHSGSNNDPNVGQFVDVLKNGIISGLTFRGLHNTNCEDASGRSTIFLWGIWCFCTTSTHKSGYWNRWCCSSLCYIASKAGGNDHVWQETLWVACVSGTIARRDMSHPHWWLSHIPSGVTDQCFHVFQRVRGGQTVSNLSFCKVGRD